MAVLAAIAKAIALPNRLSGPVAQCAAGLKNCSISINRAAAKEVLSGASLINSNVAGSVVTQAVRMTENIVATGVNGFKQGAARGGGGGGSSSLAQTAAFQRQMNGQG